MSMLFNVGKKVRHGLFPSTSPQTSKKLRRIGMSVLTWEPYVAHRRGRLIKTEPGLSEYDRTILAKVSCRISPADTMYEGDAENYLLVGLSGLRAVEAVVSRCPSLAVGNILDLPSGCGRVGRFLAARFPEADITACDLMTDMVDFCGEQLGMTPVYSEVDVEKLHFKQKYDLIWCGSLVTHLSANSILRLFRLFERSLNENGVAVFTTHGEYVAEQLMAGNHYGIGAEAAKKALSTYRAGGFAFAPYLGAEIISEYGFSLSSPAWIRSQCAQIENWQEVWHQPRGWDRHQDVFGYARRTK